MTLDPDGLWPRRPDAERDGLDEDRDIDDLDLAIGEDFPVGGGDDTWNIDADERLIGQDDDDTEARDADNRGDDRGDDAGDDLGDEDYLTDDYLR